MGSRVRSWGLRLGVMLAMLAAPAAHARELKVLVMGDSLSAAYGLRADQGWVPLADAKSARYAFHNASLSGETSAEPGKSVCTSRPPKVCTVSPRRPASCARCRWHIATG